MVSPSGFFIFKRAQYPICGVFFMLPALGNSVHLLLRRTLLLPVILLSKKTFLGIECTCFVK